MWQCAVCGKYLVNPKRCGKCRVVEYCTRKCQRADWSRHKESCTTMSDAGVQLQKYRMKYREEIEIYAARNYKNKDFVLYIIVGDYNKPPDQRPNVVGCRDMKSELLAAFPKGKGTNAKIYLAVGDQECCDEIYFETISIVGSNNRRRYYLIAGCIALILLVVLLAILLC